MLKPSIKIAANLITVMLLCAYTNEFSMNASTSTEVAQSVQSEGIALESEYTDLAADTCKIIEVNEETRDSKQACPGYDSIPVFVYKTDGRHYVNIGGTDKNEGLGVAFNHLGEKLEWRLQNDEPFAVIYRYYIDGASDKPVGSSVLAVQKISERTSGCIAGVVNGSLPNANELARKFADEKVTDFKCGVNSRQEI